MLGIERGFYLLKDLLVEFQWIYNLRLHLATCQCEFAMSLAHILIVFHVICHISVIFCTNQFASD